MPLAGGLCVLLRPSTLAWRGGARLDAACTRRGGRRLLLDASCERGARHVPAERGDARRQQGKHQQSKVDECHSELGLPRRQVRPLHELVHRELARVSVRVECVPEREGGELVQRVGAAGHAEPGGELRELGVRALGAGREPRVRQRHGRAGPEVLHAQQLRRLAHPARGPQAPVAGGRVEPKQADHERQGAANRAADDHARKDGRRHTRVRVARDLRDAKVDDALGAAHGVDCRDQHVKCDARKRVGVHRKERIAHARRGQQHMHG